MRPFRAVSAAYGHSDQCNEESWIVQLRRKEDVLSVVILQRAVQLARKRESDRVAFNLRTASSPDRTPTDG